MIPRVSSFLTIRNLKSDGIKPFAGYWIFRFPEGLVALIKRFPAFLRCVGRITWGSRKWFPASCSVVLSYRCCLCLKHSNEAGIYSHEGEAGAIN